MLPIFHNDNYKITNKRKKDISKKALFVYTGLIEKERKIAVDLLDINGGLKIIDTSYVLETQNSIEELWLNPSYLLMMAKNVELGLNEYISSSYLKKEIKENYEKLKVSLSELDADYRLSIENAKKKTLIVNNNNLKYLEKFGLTVIVLDDDAMDKTYNDVKTLIDSGQINYIYKFKDDKNSTRIESLITEYPNLKITELHKIDNITDKERDDKEDYIYELIDTLGFIEASISVASFRCMLGSWCVPEFRKDNDMQLEVRNVYHPLITKPVANSINTKHNVLLTGSNASGKSTFLKTIAINALLSQTIYTSVSEYYRAPVYRIYSSMALRDDLSSSNSYYIVEIKSLKRMLDAASKEGHPVLMFVDEVLRGTNTVERIAASSEILKSIRTDKALVFAATHDVELTSLLRGKYDNYHFQEEVTDDEVVFDFKLYTGPATTRNAIKLLKTIGYDSTIINAAERSAGYFLNNGKWNVEN